MIRRLIQRARQRFCSHVFRGIDIQGRKSYGGPVTWPCSKCGYVWQGAYGLLAPGKITGPWGEPQKETTNG